MTPQDEDQQDLDELLATWLDAEGELRGLIDDMRGVVAAAVAFVNLPARKRVASNAARQLELAVRIFERHG